VTAYCVSKSERPHLSAGTSSGPKVSFSVRVAGEEYRATPITPAIRDFQGARLAALWMRHESSMMSFLHYLGASLHRATKLQVAHAAVRSQGAGPALPSPCFTKFVESPTLQQGALLI